MKELTKSDIINIYSKEQIVSYFEDNYKIKLTNFDGENLNAENIKPALCGIDDFLKSFPEVAKYINIIKYNPKMPNTWGQIDSLGMMELSKTGLLHYETGIHESAHALDFYRTNAGKIRYSEQIVREVLKELKISRRSRIYDKLMFDYGVYNKYKKEEYELELFAYSIEKYYINKDYYKIGEKILKKLKGE